MAKCGDDGKVRVNVTLDVREYRELMVKAAECGLTVNALLAWLGGEMLKGNVEYHVRN